MNVSTPAPTTARTNGAMRSASGITTTTTIGPTPPAATSPRPHASTPASTTSCPTPARGRTVGRPRRGSIGPVPAGVRLRPRRPPGTKRSDLPRPQSLSEVLRLLVDQGHDGQGRIGGGTAGQQGAVGDEQ